MSLESEGFCAEGDFGGRNFFLKTLGRYKKFRKSLIEKI
jgi:hypothetical protein